MSETNWALSFAFPDQSPAYARGFDSGRLWEKLSLASAPFSMMFISDRREDVIAIATAKGWREEITIVNDDWIDVKFAPEGGE